MSPPDRSQTQQLVDALHRHTVAAARFRETVARLAGLYGIEAEAIAYLAAAEPLTIADFGRELDLSSGGATALVQRLERRGHIARAPNPRDARSCLLTATRRTGRHFGECSQRLTSGLEQVAGTLSEGERSIVTRLVDDATLVVEETANALLWRDADARVEDDDGCVPGLWG
jgi:DNA-binding MarR family transcriptional regulator